MDRARLFDLLEGVRLLSDSIPAGYQGTNNTGSFNIFAFLSIFYPEMSLSERAKIAHEIKYGAGQ